MNWLNYRALALLLLLLPFLSTNSYSQNADCQDLVNPILNPLPEEDPCCGMFIVETLCYEVDVQSVPPCNGNTYYLTSFIYPGGSWLADDVYEPINGLAGLASFLTQLCEDNEVDAVFTYNIEEQTICARTPEGISDFGFLQFFDCGLDDKYGIFPTIGEINECPAVIPDVRDVLSTSTPENITIFEGDIGTITTEDIIDPNIPYEGGDYVESPNMLGNMLNGLATSGAIEYGSSCINLDCWEGINVQEELINNFDPTEWPVEAQDALLMSEDFDGSLEDFMNGVEIEINDFFEEQEGGVGGFLNEMLGFNFDTSPCSGELGGGLGSLIMSPGKEPKKGDKGANEKELTAGDVGTNAGLDFFNSEIPGLGLEGAASSNPSPSALAMIQSVMGGVDLYNGSQTASIPLHTIVANDISVPISLASLSNGLKVNDLGSIVGQNWNLNAAGMISRVVQGLPDEFNGTVHGTTLGKTHKLKFRVDIPANFGLDLKFPGDQAVDFLCSPQNKIRNGIVLAGTDLSGGPNTPEDLGPVSFELRWVPLRPNMVNLTVSVPLFKFWGVTIRLQFGMNFGVSPNEIFDEISLEETSLGYLHLDNTVAMDEVGLSPLSETFLDGLSMDEANEYLSLIHPQQKRDDRKFLSELYSSIDTWLTAFNIIDGTVWQTTKIDVEPDEFYFQAGSYSGKFSLKMNGQPVLTPYQPGVVITPNLSGGQMLSFTIATPDGLVYTYGMGVVDYTENTTYILPNYYTYPEVDISFPALPSGTEFDQAQIDIGYLTHVPTFGKTHLRPYANTYQHNYKIMRSPRYISTWHLVSIHSEVTQEEVTFDYELTEDLVYFSNKNHTHSFPNFGTQGGNLVTEESPVLNPFRTISKKWANGRADFTYQATETNLDRWDLSSISTSRGESALFHYGVDRPEIVGDALCERIEIMRNGALYKGWRLKYSSGGTQDQQASCGEINPESGEVPISIPGELAFGLGDLYQPHWTEYHNYLFFNIRIRCWTLPVRFQIPYPPLLPHDPLYRSTMSEYGSLMELKSYNHPEPFENLTYEEATETAIFNAEGKRTFLEGVIGIDQDNIEYDFVPLIEYLGNTASIPKRYSVNQDQFGYVNNNSQSGSPLPPVRYQAISTGQNIFPTTNGVEKHFPFFNEETGPGTMHLGQKIQPSNATQKGALKKITLASGGSIAFSYELNELPNGQNGAGIRVSQKVEDPGDTPAKITLYSYSDPTVNNDPIRVVQHPTDVYYVGFEQRISTTSYTQNQMLPNGNAHVGYGMVQETFSGDIGGVRHYFTTPDNFLDHLPIEEDVNQTYTCLFNTRNSILDLGESFPVPCQEIHPSIELPELHRLCGNFFGLETRSEVYGANGNIEERDNIYEIYEKEDRAGLPFFKSTMDQYYHGGSFIENYGYRQIKSKVPFALSILEDADLPGVGLLNMLVQLIFANDNIEHPYKYIEKRFQTARGELPACGVRLQQTNVVTLYPGIGGGQTDSETSYSYYGAPGRQNVLRESETVSSDGIAVKTNYGYSFDEEDITINTYFEAAAIGRLNDIGYLRPLHSQVFTNDYLTNHTFTTLKLMQGDKIGPKANYSLQSYNNAEGAHVVSLRGLFEGDNGDGLPTDYFLATYGADEDSDIAEFYGPIELTWTPQRQLLTRVFTDHTNPDYSFTSSNQYSPFFEYAGSVDLNGVTTTYTYDKRTRLHTASEYSGLQSTEYVYNVAPGANFIKTLLSLDNATTQESTQYIDGFGKTKSTIRDNDGAVLNTAEYDDFWRPIVTTSLGSGALISEYESSPASRLRRTTDDEDNVFEYQYIGQSPFYRTAVKDPNGHTITKGYNSLAKIKALRKPEGSLTVFQYDDLWRLTRIINPVGEDYKYRYSRETGLMYRSEVPGAAPKKDWYDEEYRLVISEDGENTLAYEYDEFDRVVNTYRNPSGWTDLGQGLIDYSSLIPFFQSEGAVTTEAEQVHLISHVDYVGDHTTYVEAHKDRILNTDEEASFTYTNNVTIDVLGRAVVTESIYPDAFITQLTGINGAMQITSINKTIEHDALVEGQSVHTELNIGEVFSHDNVLRLSDHDISYSLDGAAGGANKIARLVYDNEDHLRVKLLGQASNDFFLQQVDYYYDDIGRLVTINNYGDYECSAGKQVCELQLDFTLPYGHGSDVDCNFLNAIRVNGGNFDLQSTVDIIQSPEELQTALEEALGSTGLTGEVTIFNEVTMDGYHFIITVQNTSAYFLQLYFADCNQNLVFETVDCCTVEGPNSNAGNENYDLVGHQTDNTDLYYQHMTYDFLDISQIELGSACTDGYMINNYSYDGQHRVTEMQNTLFLPDPISDAFSTQYSYDAAGNIQTLNRNGFLGTFDGQGLPQFGLIDQLDYTYNEPSVLSTITDDTPVALQQPFGFAHETAGYGYDSRGNMTGDGHNSYAYNLLSLPQTMSGNGVDIEQDYVATGEKYKKESTGADIAETRYYLAGAEFVDGKPASYSFGDGRLIWEEDENEEWKARPQYQISDHLGNAMVYFDDEDDDSILITERDVADGTANPDELEVIQRLWYYPFGMHLEGIGQLNATPAQQYRYNGKEFDAATGLYDYGARYYDPAIARWGQVDPLADQYVSYSPYNYVLGNPLSLTDPTGMYPSGGTGGNGNDRINTSEGPTNEYVKDKDGNYIQVGTLGGDEFDIIYDGIINDDGSVTVAPGGGESVEVEHITLGSSEMGFRFPGAKINSGGAGIATLDGFDDPIFILISGLATRGLSQIDDLGILGLAKKGKSFRGGNKKRRDGYLTSLAKEFQRWFHRYWKEPGAPNAPKSEIDDALREWINSGRPDVK